jgi:hypothetical protein
VKCSPTSLCPVGKAAAKQAEDLVGNSTRSHRKPVMRLKIEVLWLFGFAVIGGPEVINGFTRNGEDDFENIDTSGPPFSEPAFKTDSFSPW